MEQTQLKQPRDWHGADIKAALEKSGTNLHRIGREQGYAPTSAYDVLRRPMPRLERLISNILGLAPQEIWPTRYDGEGRPLAGLRSVAKSKSMSPQRPMDKREPERARIRAKRIKR